MSLMIPEFFGGEGGVSANRVVGKPLHGHHLRPADPGVLPARDLHLRLHRGDVRLHAHAAGPHAQRGARQPERVEFIGYNTQRVRYFAFIIAGFFAGIAGGMYALNFEIATAEVVGAGRSGAYLLFTFLGGATFFFGPIIGAMLMVVAFVLLSELTKAWLLYLGLIFMFMVMYAPGGIASLIMMNLRVAEVRQAAAGCGPSYLALAGTALIVLIGAAAMIEMVYHLQLERGARARSCRFLGATLDAGSVDSWFGAALVTLVGVGAVRSHAPPVRQAMGRDPGDERSRRKRRIRVAREALDDLQRC